MKSRIIHITIGAVLALGAAGSLTAAAMTGGTAHASAPAITQMYHDG